MGRFSIRPVATAFDPRTSTIVGPIYGKPIRVIEGTLEEAERAALAMGEAPIPDGFLPHHVPLSRGWNVSRKWFW